MLDGQLDSAMLGLYEQKFEKSRFTRVDSDVVDRLISKENSSSTSIESEKEELLESVFSTELPQIEKTEFHVEVQGIGSTGMPLVITQSEYMRRMKDMSRLQPGMSFYGEMPDMLNLVVNSDHPLIKEILDLMDSSLSASLSPIDNEISGLNARRESLNAETKDKKWEDVPQTIKDDLSSTEKQIEEAKGKKRELISKEAKDNKKVHQLIDLALLKNGLLRGESLDSFIRRSVDLIK
jgi:molecular chaperone HtpG